MRIDGLSNRCAARRIVFRSLAKLHNLLEPSSLVGHFLDNPPEGFGAVSLDGGAPSFTMRFNLLTTLEPAVRKPVEALTIGRWGRRLLSPMTRFIGTTVSEYALFPASLTPEEFLAVVSRLTRDYALVIVKDIPTEAILAGDAALDYSRDFADACRRGGFVLVKGQALAYVPIDFASTDEFLSRLSHARRKNIRRKLRSATSLQVDEIPTGDARFDDDEFVTTLYRLYENVFAQSDIHFDLLTLPFFRAILRDAAVDGIVFVYRAAGVLIGYNLCISRKEMLIDKYVGFLYPDAHEHDLYTVSWFHNLDYAREHRLRYYVAGWTDPEVKKNLGARFTFTMHAVHVRNPIVRMFLRILKPLFEADRRWQEAHDSRNDP